MALADWMLSSRVWTTQTITINASAQDIEASLGGLYLVHTTAAASMLQQLYLAMAAAGLTSPTATITKGRRVKLTASAPFSITWGGGGSTLRDLLGFEDDLELASSYVATLQSPLLWSGGRPASPTEAPIDAHGRPRIDGSAVIGPRGVQTVRINGLPTYTQTFEWRHVAKARWWGDPLTNPDGVAGDWRHFWESEALASRKLALLRRVTEGADGDTTDADYSASYVLGPYVARLSDGRRVFDFEMERELATVEKYYRVRLPLVVTEEFSA